MAQAGIKGGLLAKAEHYLGSNSKDTAHAFYAWAAVNKVSHACVLQNICGKFIPVYAVGMDAPSLVQLCSSGQFWAGLLPSENSSWHSFLTAEAMQPLYQLFSPLYRQCVTAVHILRAENAIVLIPVLEKEAFTLPEAGSTSQYITATGGPHPRIDDGQDFYEAAISSGLNYSPAYLFLLSLKLALEEAVISCPYKEQSIIQALKSSIYTELYAQCKTLFQKPNVSHSGSNDEIKIVCFSKNEPDEMLLRFHISKSFAPILGPAAQRIVLLRAGTSSKVQGAAGFLVWG